MNNQNELVRHGKALTGGLERWVVMNRLWRYAVAGMVIATVPSLLLAETIHHPIWVFAWPGICLLLWGIFSWKARHTT